MWRAWVPICGPLEHHVCRRIRRREVQMGNKNRVGHSNKKAAAHDLKEKRAAKREKKAAAAGGKRREREAAAS